MYELLVISNKLTNKFVVLVKCGVEPDVDRGVSLRPRCIKLWKNVTFNNDNDLNWQLNSGDSLQKKLIEKGMSIQASEVWCF
jgi:hypothetical protein